MNSDPAVFHDLRSTVERLASPNASLVEWASRRGLSSGQVARTSCERLTRALDADDDAVSRVLQLRLRALADELLSLVCAESEPTARSPEPFRHVSWTLVRHLAQSALREPGWP